MSPTNGSVSFKFILVGDSGVGKSCLVNQLTREEFVEHPDLTIGAAYEPYKMQIEDRTVKLQIWDLGGQDTFRDSIAPFYSGATCAFLVFDLCDRSTFLRLNSRLQTLREFVGNPSLVVFLLGNKIDLADNQWGSIVTQGRGVSKLRTREVSRVESERFAEANSLTYFETSAKSGVNVADAFKAAGQKVLLQLWDGEYDVSRNTGIHGIRFLDNGTPAAAPYSPHPFNPFFCCVPNGITGVC
eukprot:GEMP01029636.1.p1 GENE.GEMP01029636.1~~GEMP01029636.1.p1  ORF type:complete len:242 (+),score=35.47 GEMP01029636.1:133-858(+)